MPVASAASELDLAILDSLSLSPRASWAQLAKVLEVDASTVARRWQRMREEGVAWSVCVRGTRSGENRFAHFDVSVRPAAREALGRRLAEDPRCLSVSSTFGGGGLRVLADLPPSLDLDAMMSGEAWSHPDVTGIDASVVVRVHQAAHRWVSGGISPAQMARLDSAGEDEPVIALTALERGLAALLQEDTRMSVSEIADRLGLSLASASRLVQRALRTGALQLLVQSTPEAVGWPHSVALFWRVPANRQAEFASAAARLPGMRGVHEVFHSRWSMLTMFWARTMKAVAPLEHQLASTVPGAEVTARQLTSRHFKRMGVVFDADGRAARFVPPPV